MLNPMETMRKVAGYQDGLAVLLGLTFGVVMFDRGAINFLAPFIVTDLKLSNAQLGIAASVVSLTWALAGCLIGRASDGSGQRKPYLILAVIAFSLCSIASGFAGSFVMLVAFRLLMGLGDGVVPPMTTALLFDASSAHRRGLNFGIYAFFTGLVGGFLAPPIIVALATQFNWRIAFFLAGIPGLLAAAAIALFVRETSVPRALAVDASRRMPPSRLRDVLRGRNIRLCALSASLLLAFQIVMMVFLPLFLVRERHLSPSDMGIVMSAVGAAMLAGGLALPALSDRFGRRTVLAASAVLGATLPLTCLYWTGHLAGLAALCAVAGFAGALPHIAIGIVPAESAAPQNRGAALGLVMGTAEILGGFAAPAITGLVADNTGLVAAPIIAGCCAFAGALLSLGLEETAPARIKLRAGSLPAAAVIVSE